jgi:hypothetical protein
MRFDYTAVTWSAAFDDIAAVKYAVIWKQGASAGAQKLLCHTQLSAAQFAIPSGYSFNYFYKRWVGASPSFEFIGRFAECAGSKISART